MVYHPQKSGFINKLLPTINIDQLLSLHYRWCVETNDLEIENEHIKFLYILEYIEKAFHAMVFSTQYYSYAVSIG